ncbi:MAG: hypothetical protein GTO45_37130, partial [Candidatus Aminicenantes bacterium]|nr:hypothetical protein [Candidatus Aminicenantes bacterium]NIM84290.1 hypothetical protein [Candidatus Aminicenantes bacterium]NIN23776.1 hypothetical protein [Candidatus Aminicenantes bacterium]NIN47492.1 hypothetical protein [Candidatus Aminicenantes bacterium]NIN90412.1 hypothetical protein [Candidatus Aminicenantes bacterium]
MKESKKEKVSGQKSLYQTRIFTIVISIFLLTPGIIKAVFCEKRFSPSADFHAVRVLSVAFSPDGNTLASGSDDSIIRLWEVDSGKEIGKFTGHSSFVTSVVFSPDGKVLASGSSDTTIRVW